MGFGLDVKVEAPKVAAPKVAVPDVAGAAAGAAAGVAAGAQAAAAGAAAKAKAAVTGAAGAAAKSLSAVAGALAEVAVSFQGPCVDVAMEPHMVLDANASFGETRFEKGPVWIRVDLAPEKAKSNTDTLRLFTAAGDYDRKKAIREFDEGKGKTVDVLFDEAPMDQAFSLEVIPAGGPAHLIFSGVPYGDLRKTKNRI